MKASEELRYNAGRNWPQIRIDRAFWRMWNAGRGSFPFLNLELKAKGFGFALAAIHPNLNE